MEDTFLTREIHSMSQDAVGGMSNIDWRLLGECFPYIYWDPYLVEALLDYESMASLNLGGSTKNFQPTASDQRPFFLDPQLCEEFILGLPTAGEDFPEISDDSFNSGYLAGNAAPEQPGQPIINIDDPFQSLYPAGI